MTLAYAALAHPAPTDVPMPDWRPFAEQLAGAGIESADHDARRLVVHALDIGVDAAGLVARRVAREPLQLIMGTAAFREIELAVRKGVLIPRPETEVVVGVALERLGAMSEGPLTVADVGTGAGPIALSLAVERPRTHVVAVDISRQACDLVEHNLGLLERQGALADESHVTVLQADLLAGLGELDAVVSNPPYLPAADADEFAHEVSAYDPERALLSGDDGLDLTRDLVAQAGERVRTGGVLVLELDPRNVHQAVPIVSDAGFTDVTIVPDLTGRDRCLAATKA